LVLASDMAFARPGAKFAAAYAELGLAADGGMSWSLPRRIGHARGRDGASRSLANQLIVEAGAMGDLAGSDCVRTNILALE
jgi:2-(1,2-epoxy-1,2-dihydrophenyl)acetyl-CoA isomerase